MPRTLPARPSFEQLRKQAKELHRAHAGGDAASCETLRRLNRFRDAADAEILAARGLPLAEMQFALAMEYGFASWTEMKRAVTGEDGSRVRREGQRVWIEGLPAPQGECTYCAALASALTATRHPVGYASLLAASGLAFRVRWFRAPGGERWCASSPVAEFADEMRAIASATGWTQRCDVRMGQQDPDMSDLLPPIRASVESGRPVLAYDERLDFGVIVGHESDELLWLDGDDVVARPCSALGPFVVWLDERIEPVDAAAALRLALGGAHWRRDAQPLEDRPGAAYHLGSAALRIWGEDLAAAEDFDEDDRRRLFFVSWFCYTHLVDARQAGASYLNELAEGQPDEVATALRRAAGACGAAASAGRPSDAFLGPWSRKSYDDWTPEVRAREREILAMVAERDAEMRAALDEALALI